LIYVPTGGEKENPQIQQMYRKTHGNFAPGEQKKRDYNWGFEPADQIFGYSEKKVLNGAAMALQMERNAEQFP